MTENTDFSWADAVAFGVLLTVALVLIAIAASVYVQLRKARIAADRLDDYRQLVRRYEQLAEGTMDAAARRDRPRRAACALGRDRAAA